MKKIVFAGLLTDSNLGDRVIYDCTVGLFERVIGKNKAVVFSGLDLTKKYVNESLLHKIYRKIKRKLLGLTYSEQVALLSDVYKKQIKGASLVVVCGGGVIKYKYQAFWLYLSALIKASEKLNIPVFFNACGVEGYDERNKKCQILKQYLNRKIVCKITTRDDFETLFKDYLNGNTDKASLVCDPAVWCGDIYKIKKNKNSDMIGIGLIRKEIFEDNGVALDKDISVVYVDIIKNLERRGFRYRLFTNGLKKDLNLLDSISQGLGCKKEDLEIDIPETPSELVNIISQFKGVIAARLHANIISYALDIPSVGLVWNDKLPLFGEIIGYPDRFIKKSEFSGNYIVGKLEEAMINGYEIENVSKYKSTVIESIRSVLLEQEII